MATGLPPRCPGSCPPAAAPTGSPPHPLPPGQLLLWQTWRSGDNYLTMIEMEMRVQFIRLSAKPSPEDSLVRSLNCSSVLSVTNIVKHRCQVCPPAPRQSDQPPGLLMLGQRVELGSAAGEPAQVAVVHRPHWTGCSSKPGQYCDTLYLTTQRWRSTR